MVTRGSLLVLLCTALCGIQAQSEESAAIIQTTVLSFRLSGAVSSNFSTQMQAKFSDQLRALLQSYNFMSIAVSDYANGTNYVDVSVRAVDATDAQNLTSTWEMISNQALVTNTFMNTFNALLLNAGVQGNATLLGVAGVNSPAGFNVTFTVDMTVNGSSSLVPFDSTKQQQLLTPITSFLGDHGTARIMSANDTSDGAQLNLNVTLDANTMPQFWFFLSNQTTLRASLPSLGGNTLNTAITGYTVVGAVSTTPSAPSPSGAAGVPPVSSSQASAPVTAAQATGAEVPPVASSTSGTVTMNIGMNLYGSSVQPFTPEVQFHAASAMAGVFWIIIGTGSVQLISFTSGTATSEPASTARATTQQYGRRLLQASPPSSNGSQPVESVVFAVTLPAASQNSLLVLQSSSPTVRQQFAGWFVTQMQARNYTVDADVTSVSVSSVTGASSSASPPASPTTSSTPVSAVATDNSSNTGAIVGGVVGGVVGLGVIALLFLWLYHRQQRQKHLDAKGALTRDSDSDTMKPAPYWDSDAKSPPSSVYTQDADELKKTIVGALSNGSMVSSETPLYRSPLYTRMTELDSGHIDDVRRLLHKRKQKQSSPLTETSEHQAAALLSALSSLAPGSLYYDKYVVEQGQQRGKNSILTTAHVKASEGEQVVIKFMPDHGIYRREKLFYENRQALEGEAASVFLPILYDAFDGTPLTYTESDEAIPPSLVMERGSFTLADYLSGRAVNSPDRPENLDRHHTLYNLCKAVEYLHARSLVHGGLSTSSAMWFARAQKWKLIGFGNWARAKEVIRVSYDLRYAAPELLLADLAGMQQLAATEACDMWALGCIAFELLSGREVFGDQYSEEEIMSMLIGFVKLPWEENPEFFTDNLPPPARNFVADLLQRSPEARKPISTLLHSTLFSEDVLGSMPATIGRTQDLATPNNLFSTSSEWL